MNPRTRIKICGLTREADVDAAVEAGADAVGFVLWPQSPRAVSIDRAAVLAERLPPFVTPVLLFVNEPWARVLTLLEAIPNAIAQFHGDETPDECRMSVTPRGQPARRFMRAARMAPGFDLLNFAQQFSHAQALLLDAHVEGYGGGGKVFNWSLIPANVPCPVVLSGGLHAGNVTRGIQQVRPWAVDVSSGVESAKGIKDAQAIRRFCDAVCEADARIAASIL
ncbi:MAG TPA: phosphoribosylanthranilate isomerase [Burkholderiaceae bacterium]|nr:phosphoribosylanthranilate isomerase [Burkholderiaceae bacterium]